MSSVQSLLDTFGVESRAEGHHHCRPGWIQIDCPFCGQGSDGFHMGWNLHFNYVNCWRCGKHSVIETLAKLSGLSFAECKTAVSQLETKAIPKAERPTGKLVLPKGRRPLEKAHITYLRRRGFDPDELVRLWGLEGIGIASRLQWRIFIPIHLRSEIVSWTTRSIGEQGLRYVSASPHEESVAHKSLLYGEQYCRHKIVVVEGCPDTWTIGPGCVGTCGIGFSIRQVQRIAKYPVRAICFNSEPIAQQRAHELCALLEPYPGETFNVVLDGNDANTSSKKDIRRIRKHFLGA